MNGNLDVANHLTVHAESIKRTYFILFNILVCISTVNLSFFLHGFFPLNFNVDKNANRNNIPYRIGNISIYDEKLINDDVYKSQVSKVVLVVMDPVSWNSFNRQYNSDESNYFKGHECLYKTKFHSPMVPLTRIKALMTGTISNYIDVILNLRSTEMIGDNILKQCNYLKTIFYGGLQWTTFFPHMFNKYRLMYNVMNSNIIDLDSIVMSDLREDIDEMAWNFMILDYTVLSHREHMPESLAKMKTDEMNNILRIIQEKIKENDNKNNKKTLLLVTVDREIRESHGSEETFAPLLAFGIPCKNSQHNDVIHQIDIVSTLAVLLGIPIPYSNMGSVILPLMSDMSVSQRLFALYYNAEQLIERFFNNTNYAFYKEYQKAINLHIEWINNRNHLLVYKIIKMYKSCIFEMQHIIKSHLFKYDNFIMVGSLVVMLAVTLLIGLISIPYYKLLMIGQDFSVVKFVICSCISFFIWLSSWFIFIPVRNWLPDQNGIYSAAFFFSVALLTINLTFVKINRPLEYLHFYLNKKCPTNFHFLLPAITLFHAMCLGSIRFIQEEHKILYYVMIFSVIFIAYVGLKRMFEGASVELSVVWLFALFFHRAFVMFKMSDYRIENYGSIVDWFYVEPTDLRMSIYVIYIFGVLLYIDWRALIKRKSVYITMVFNLILGTLIYMRHSVDDTTLRPPFLPEPEDTEEVKIFWIVMIIYTIFNFCEFTIASICKEENIINFFIYLILKNWVLVSAFLHRPHNLILLPCQMLFNHAIFLYTETKNRHAIKVLLYTWSGNLFFFLQGNTNSLSTVDLETGYIGLEQRWPYITATYLLVNTYSAPILSFIMYLYDLSFYRQLPVLTPESMAFPFQQYIFWRLVPNGIYMFIIFLNRHHVHIWTVLASKLLYEAAHTFTLCFVILTIQPLLFLHKAIFH